MPLVVFVVVLIIAAAAVDLDSEWAEFKVKYNKKYEPKMDEHRKNIWLENRRKIAEHNKLHNQGLSTYSMGENRLTDMTTEEVTSTLSGSHRILDDVEPEETPSSQTISFIESSLPAMLDWRRRGWVTRVKDQGNCGACWAFSVTGAVEAQHCNVTKKLVELSESNLIDCTRRYGTKGCASGSLDAAFSYVMNNRGIDTEKSYPYRGKAGKCDFQRKDVGGTFKLTSLKNGPLVSIVPLMNGHKNVLYFLPDQAGKCDFQRKDVGPISVVVDANHTSFHQYKGGVYDEPNCRRSHLTHSVLVVGYGTYKSKKYWLVKNSWGTSWGMNGYIMMSRYKHNQCGIATEAFYVYV